MQQDIYGWLEITAINSLLTKKMNKLIWMNEYKMIFMNTRGIPYSSDEKR